MRRTALYLVLALLAVEAAQAQKVDSFDDGDFTANPAWSGDTASWTIVANATSGPNATGSNTLRLGAASGPATQHLSTQRAGSWGTEQSWGCWLGRRAGAAATTSNRSYVWLYASEADLEAATVDGYRIRFGDNSAGDEIVLERVDDGSATAILSSSGAVANGLTDIGLLVRVTRTSASGWTLFTSVLPTANGEGPGAGEAPSAANTPVNQGSTTDATYTSFDGGYLGFMADHTNSAPAREGAEFDQLYFDTDATSPLPVELVAFTAVRDGRAVLLRWTTASETNNAGFEVQIHPPASDIRNPQWDAAAWVAGQGTTEQAHHYAHRVEGLPAGVHRFRLKQIDYDGTFAYSPQVEVFLDVPGVYHLSAAYPNPFRRAASFSLSVARAQRVAVAVYDLLGRRVALLHEGRFPAATTRAFRFDAGGLPGGLYVIRIEAERFAASRAVVRAR